MKTAIPSVEQQHAFSEREIHPMLIGGEWIPGRTTQKIFYPADQTTVVGECFLLDDTRLPHVLRSAESGFEHHRKTTPDQRAAMLNRLAGLLEKNDKALAKLITLEAGKPIMLSQNEVSRAISVCRAYAYEVMREGPVTVYADDGHQGRVGYFPLGPVLAITPFNFPLNLVIHKLAPAIAAGCSIVIKPAPQTPLTALFLGRLALEAGYSAISVVPTINEMAQKLVESDVFKKFSFTGSAHVGWHLKSLANKKSVTLELGGNAAVVIEDFTEPVETIAERVAFGAFAYAGQICISVQRIFVRQPLLEEFTQHFKLAVRNLKVGDPMDETTMVGPLIHNEQMQRTRDIIKDAVFNGGNVVYGGNTYNVFTLNPTVVDRVSDTMRIVKEECFAPLVALESYSNFGEALAQVNNSQYGLQTGIYVASNRQIERAYQQLDVGGVVINDIPTYRMDLLPYGGVKESGMGREGVMAGIASMSYQKTLIIKS